MLNLKKEIKNYLKEKPIHITHRIGAFLKIKNLIYSVLMYVICSSTKSEQMIFEDYFKSLFT